MIGFVVVLILFQTVLLPVIPIVSNFDNDRIRLYPDTSTGTVKCSSSISWTERYIENINSGPNRLDIDSIPVIINIGTISNLDAG